MANNKIMTITKMLAGFRIRSNINKNDNLAVSYRNFFDFTAKNNRKIYEQKKLVGFSMEQMFNVVSDVENYNKFVPFCNKSYVITRKPNFIKADLAIGFPPINESYTSHVTMIRPTQVKAECLDGKLFNYLLTNWKFSPGVKDISQSCVIDFTVDFEFKSIIHTQISLLFFDQLVKQMEFAFVKEAANRYGKPKIKSHVLVTNKN